LKLSVIIVSYNVRYFLEQCLCSLLESLREIEAEVWIVDNASKDGTVEYLKPRFPDAKFIENEVNLGFAKANNRALKKCIGRYVLFLNPDTILSEDCVSKSITFIEGNQQAGAIGIRMIDGRGDFLPESKRAFPKPLTSLFKLMGLSTFFPSSKIFSRYSLGYLDPLQNHEVDVLAGAFLLARRDILVDLEGFDEAFFMYGEDIDLSFRIQSLGYKNYYLGENTIIHFKGESSRKGSLNHVKMFYQAMSIFVKKHYGGTSALFTTSFLHLAIWIRAGVSATAGLIRRSKSILLKKRALILKQKRTIIVGNDEEVAEVLDIFRTTGTDAIIVGSVSVKPQTDLRSVIEDLGSILQTMVVDEIVFCCGCMSYKSIIDIIQKVPAGVSFRFHRVGTDSIVGSDSKNRAGEFVAVR
jgi:GT2 family glycosyltransferase